MGSLRKRKVATIQSPYIKQHEEKIQTGEKKRRGLIRRLTLYAVCAVVLSVMAASALISQAAVLEEKTAEKKLLQKKLAKLEHKEVLLEEEIVKLNDDEYIAKIARKDYFLSNKGEIIFNLPKKEEDSD
ncbi:cell division protein DIVIC [Bacillus sp. M6-12]|uniref:FtsB family cell division protein n=1 Tax=Bacillus sp. M6-12 TaxID=2054166 RepID=UPI000C766807|nr:septum formation initiator family protein [Bacillus sp. M6-12]PLS15131.1 cell division protein DIVIC [Bacillus sp. M6-12]